MVERKIHKFQILSRIAKHIHAIPTSAIGKRVFDEKRTHLAPYTIQICVCKKNWGQANIRQGR